MVKHNSLFPAPNSQPHWESALKQTAKNPNPGWRKGSTFHMRSVNTAGAEGRERWGPSAEAWGGWDTIQAQERAACLRGAPRLLTHSPWAAWDWFLSSLFLPVPFSSQFTRTDWSMGCRTLQSHRSKLGSERNEDTPVSVWSPSFVKSLLITNHLFTVEIDLS